MDKAREFGAMSATLRVGRSFGTRLPKKSNEEASVTEACVIKKKVFTDNNVRMEVAMDRTSTSDSARTLPTPVLDTSAVDHESPRKTGEMYSDDDKVGDRDE